MWNRVRLLCVTLALLDRLFPEEEPVGRRAARVFSVVAASAALLTASACSSGGHKTASWQPVEFHGVHVEIPTAWKPVRSNECGFQFAERYPDSTICNRTPGVM